MHNRVSLFGVEIDALDMRGALDTLLGWIDTPSGACRYVVTPNVDHTVLLQEHALLRDVYAEAGLVLADGAPVVLAARLLGKPLPERVTGSDLVPQLCQRSQDAGRPLRLFLLGAMPGVAERAKQNVEARWPSVHVADVYSPPLGFEKDPAENDRILTRIEAAEVDVLVVGLGAPKQEFWVHAHRDRIAARAALCVGATIDFLAGEKRRAPRWMQRGGLEWLHRVVTEPKRLARRYARDAWLFPQIVWREWLGGSPRSTSRG
ncbi:MAG: WecB/TagA/CpsF family glycosyltransferase [Planctomycetales bacterium]|nr:WecB/TagA/CpsF family glycosyltransferase [Planctomycetales bacterium]